MLGRQDREAREAGLAGDRLERRRTQDRAGPDRRRVDEAVGQAGDDAVAVEQSLGLVAGRREPLGDALVADEHGATGREQAPRGREDLGRPGHVVDGLEDRHEVVAAGALAVGRIGEQERDPVGQPGRGRVGLRSLDRARVDVDAVDLDPRELAGDRDRRPARAAGDVRDPALAVTEARGDVRQRVDPVADEMGELGPVDRPPGPRRRRVRSPPSRRRRRSGTRRGVGHALRRADHEPGERRQVARGSPRRRGPPRDRPAACTAARRGPRRRRRRRGSRRRPGARATRGRSADGCRPARPAPARVAGPPSARAR